MKKTALLIGVYQEHTGKDSCIESLDELMRLTETYGFETVEKVPCHVRKFNAAHLIGKGKLEELRGAAEELDIGLILFDDELAPHQQRNLEKVFKRPVLDRTELILEVFAQRAETREARLQVELAKIHYELPRLKRMWTHLSRQVAGGGGFTKGEGEKQIELDKRMLRHRITRLEQEIKEVSAHRRTQRKGRLRKGIPTFALVGYTNAGKSTLLNALTRADILAEDKLFATLDTTTRKYTLPNNQPILLIDTVGFIRKLPHNIVAAFKSTLEEAIHTDVLLHLVDASSPTALAQAAATVSVLKELGAENQPTITILNKVDQVQDPQTLTKLRATYPHTIPISALNQTGFDELFQKMIETIQALRKTVKLNVPQSHYALVSELMEKGRVLHLEYVDNDVQLEVEIPASLEHKVEPFISS